MKRWSLALVFLVPLALVACEDKNKKPSAQAEPAPSDSGITEIGPVTSPPATSDPYATDPMITPRGTSSAYSPPPQQYEELPPVSSPTMTPRASRAEAPPPMAEPSPRGGRVHVVSRGETLSSISRQYYGTPNRWRDIWNANKAKVPDPKKMQVGTRLVIP
ncbi:MAG: LysM peptidoglycan-binding domain-containing protein [Phycisphaerales bacterium]|nr:LysM peptidoglycan-binding domain-containing protein [Phycisphaerales bacterium]